MNTQKTWGGRFNQSPTAFVESFTSSIDFDARLGEVDAECSIAHAETLLAAGILSQEEFDTMSVGLKTIIQEIQTDTFDWRTELEDVHMNIETRLIELIGDTGRKLHTARSRNDQVTSSFRVFLLRGSAELCDQILILQQSILDQAEQHIETIMPGFTHLQNAQPITFGHHLMAWFEMVDRDLSRLRDWQERTNVSPLGSAALAGTSFPIDRSIFQTRMGFKTVSKNSLDSVSDRDYVVELVSTLSMLMVHLSRWSEEIILWNTPAFGFIELPDELCTGSSIMPQKKNPDLAELIRGKCGRVVGSLNALLLTLKGQPLAYNRDNQEDKEAVFDAFDTTMNCVNAMTLLVDGMSANVTHMLDHAAKGFSTATDMADWLVRKGVPFRSAHEICGKAVAMAESRQCGLEELPLKDLRSLSVQFNETVYATLTLEGSVNSRSHPGGTAPESVAQAIKEARKNTPSPD